MLSKECRKLTQWICSWSSSSVVMSIVLRLIGANDLATIHFKQDKLTSSIDTYSSCIHSLLPISYPTRFTILICKKLGSFSLIRLESPIRPFNNLTNLLINRNALMVVYVKLQIKFCPTEKNLTLNSGHTRSKYQIKLWLSVITAWSDDHVVDIYTFWSTCGCPLLIAMSRASTSFLSISLVLFISLRI